MRRIHSSHCWLTPAARTAVKGGCSSTRREAGLTLDGRRSEGYARERAGMKVLFSTLCFQYVYAAMVQQWFCVYALLPGTINLHRYLRAFNALPIATM
jgi:hypothetical protein